MLLASCSFSSSMVSKASKYWLLPTSSSWEMTVLGLLLLSLRRVYTGRVAWFTSPWFRRSVCRGLKLQSASVNGTLSSKNIITFWVKRSSFSGIVTGFVDISKMSQSDLLRTLGESVWGKKKQSFMDANSHANLLYRRGPFPILSEDSLPGEVEVFSIESSLFLTFSTLQSRMENLTFSQASFYGFTNPGQNSCVVILPLFAPLPPQLLLDRRRLRRQLGPVRLIQEHRVNKVIGVVYIEIWEKLLANTKPVRRWIGLDRVDLFTNLGQRASGCPWESLKPP